MFLVESSDKGRSEIINVTSVFCSLARKMMENVKMELVRQNLGTQDYQRMYNRLPCHTMIQRLNEIVILVSDQNHDKSSCNLVS